MIKAITRKVRDTVDSVATTVTGITKVTLLLGIMCFMGAVLIAGACVAIILSIIGTLLQKLIPSSIKKEMQQWK